MASLDLFLPALLGGFVFVTRFYALRAWTARAEGYKLVFAAAYKMMDPIDLQPFEVVILVREIQQVAPFDLDLSEHHFEPQPDEPPTPATGTERA